MNEIQVFIIYVEYKVRKKWQSGFGNMGLVKNIIDDDFPFPMIFIIITYLLIVMIMDELSLTGVIFTGFLVIIGIASLIIYFKAHQVKKRKVEQPIIEEMIKIFINKAISDLQHDLIQCKGFEFPDSLNYYFGISTNTDAFRRFSKRNENLVG